MILGLGMREGHRRFLDFCLDEDLGLGEVFVLVEAWAVRRWVPRIAPVLRVLR